MYLFTKIQEMQKTQLARDYAGTLESKGNKEDLKKKKQQG
jgi:hypothetical protein